MKRLLKKNQIIIASLAIMIVIAGYLNFTAEQTTPVKQTTVQETSENVEVDASVAAAESAVYGDISEADLQSEQVVAEITSFPEEDIDQVGEAVLTSSSASSFSASAKLNREQVRSKNESSLLAIINNTEISEDMKADAIASMNALTDHAEKELAAELLLEAKGFSDCVVSMNDETVDVIIGLDSITETQRAQIEDIVSRKTDSEIAAIVITTLNE